jgi:hypothetical protein
VRGPARLSFALPLMISLSALLWATPARTHGSVPEPQQILLRADRPEQLIVATNFGLIFSEDGGETWLFSCEHGASAYAGQYLLGAPPSNRILGMTSGAGVIYSDDESCSWNAAGGVLSDVLPYAFAVDPSNWKRVYAIGAPRENLRAGDSIYVSDDGGLTFGEPAYTAPPGSALLTVSVAPSQPSTLFATMFSVPDFHPILLRSRDSGEHWESFADLVDSLGQNPFQLLAIDALDDSRLYARLLGASAETLAISEDGGLSFVQSVSIPGKLNAFLRLASGTILVGGTAGTDALAYRSKDGARTFEPWPEAPHIHALAERQGKLYVGADNFADGYVIAESDDEGVHLRPLTGFQHVRAVRSCVVDVCAERCAYHAGIKLWSIEVCGESALPAAGGAPPDAGADEPLPVETTDEHPSQRVSAGHCGCDLVDGRPTGFWTGLFALVSMLSAARRIRRSNCDA